MYAYFPSVKYKISHFDALYISYISDRVILLIQFACQASVVLLWHNGASPWMELQKPDPLARFLSLFITWSLLRFLQGTGITSLYTSLYDVRDHHLVNRFSQTFQRGHQHKIFAAEWGARFTFCWLL